MELSPRLSEYGATRRRGGEVPMGRLHAGHGVAFGPAKESVSESSPRPSAEARSSSLII